MIGMASSLELLRQRLALLPGVGPKMAERLAFYLLRAPSQEVDQLIRTLEDARRQVVYCPICFTCTEETPCRICSDTTRDAQLICVVEQPPDVDALEKTKAFRGRYHVLHGALSPLDGIGPPGIENRRVAQARAGRRCAGSDHFHRPDFIRRNNRDVPGREDQDAGGPGDADWVWTSHGRGYRICR